MSPTRTERAFSPIPVVRSTRWSCSIDGEAVRPYLLDGSFPMGLITEELVCEMELENSGEQFTDRFSQGDEIIFLMDFENGTTVQFKGEVEEIRKVYTGGFFKLKIKGAHWTARFLDVMVNEEFTGAQLSTIRTTLISEYASGFTSNNVTANTQTESIKFVNKPLLDCLIDLDILGDEDTFVDNDKDLNTFKKNSHENLNMHFAVNDSLLDLSGLGSDSVEVRNKINVYGEAGGLPVIHAAEDSASQSTYRTKEKVITDTSIVNEDQAQATGDAELEQLKDPKQYGSVNSLLWEDISPGDSAYVISPIHKVHDKFRIVKYVFKVPSETMEVYFNNERSIPKLFKDRIKKSQGQERITNPFNMTRSYVLTFDDSSNIDVASSSGYIIENGKIRKDPTLSPMIVYTNPKTSDITAKSASLSAIGESLDAATYSFIADPTATAYQAITPNATATSTVTTPGTSIRVKIQTTSDSVRIDSLGFYWRT